MRRYDDPVEVRHGTLDQVPGPEQFLWRGRLFKVRTVLAHWVEGGARRDGGEAGPVAVLDPVAGLTERERWRVRAGRGGLEGDDVFDLAFDGADGSWLLVAGDDRAGR